MDLNELLANHQRAVMNQRASNTRADRETYFDLVEYYARRIRNHRRSSGVGDHRWAIRSGH
jgi:hypothetical protein